MRILTGIQPSGKLTLGNYFGAMKPAIELQEKGEAFLFIANYHSLTSVSDPEALKLQTWDVALDFLACGLDPERTTFWVQSDVPEVTELTWLLSIVTPMGLLERCTSYKDKVAQGIASNHGLFAYPVLMAADILAFQSTVVPVGKDQKQHLEVTRDIATKFNRQYGEVFKIPKPLINDDVAVVPGTDGQKMSKSYGNTIDLFGGKKDTKKRIMRIVTDSKELEDAKDPDTCTVFALYKLFASQGQQDEMRARYTAGGMGYGDAKKGLFDLFWDSFEEFREKREQLAGDIDYVKSVLDAGAVRARAEARVTLDRVREAMGVSI